jgi:hypothetical protein
MLFTTLFPSLFTAKKRRLRRGKTSGARRLGQTQVVTFRRLCRPLFLA